MIVCNKPIKMRENERSHIIGALRAALNAAEGGSDEITIFVGNDNPYEIIEITWNLADGEFYVDA